MRLGPLVLAPDTRSSRGWAFLLLAILILPAITWGEMVEVPIGGVDWNLRVLTYFAVAAITGLFAIPALIALRRPPAWLIAMLVLDGWLVVTALLGGQSPVEWFPTLVRLALYTGAALVAFDFARHLASPEMVVAVSRRLPNVVLLAAIVPAVAGIAEIVAGTAPLLNGAQRISGSMPSHPVAYSLFLAVCVLTTIGPAIIARTRWAAVIRWAAIVGLTALVFATYTRLSVLLIVGGAVAIAALLPARPKVRVTRAAVAAAVSAVVIFLAVPTFEARFTHPTPLGSVIDPGSSGSPTIPTGPGASHPITPGQPTDDPGIAVDNSVAFKLMLAQRGLEYWSRSPLIGHGPGSFDRLFEAESGIEDVAAHNDLMGLAVDAGLPGPLLYVLVLALIAWALWPRSTVGLPEADVLIVGALVVLGAVNLGAVIHNPLYFVELQLPIWVLVGTALGVRAWWAADGGGASTSPSPMDATPS